jgi:DNA-binding beta-propeller fold protein YncE
MKEHTRRPIPIRALLGLTLAGTTCLLAPPAVAELVLVEALFDVTVGGSVSGLDGALLPALSPDGENVYVPAFQLAGVGGELAVLARNPFTGRLTQTGLVVNGEAAVTGLDGPFAAAVSPDGAHVYVTAVRDNSVVVFARNQTNGQLSFLQAQIDGVSGVEGLGGPRGLALSPDGEHLYVAGLEDDAVVVFSRNATSGALTFVEARYNTVGGVSELESPTGVMVSPDGTNVYVTAAISNSVVTFARSQTTGALLFVDAISGADIEVEGLLNPGFLAISPDGAHVYVAGTGEGAVVVLERVGGFGQLSFVEALFDGIQVPDGLDGAINVAVSPDGSRVYASSSTDDAIAEFGRNGLTGELAYLQAAFEGVDGIEGIQRPIGLVASNDGRHLYATAFSGRSIAAFATVSLIFADDFESADTSWWSATVP